MQKYLCTVCGYVYDPKVGDEEAGVTQGTNFEAVEESWVCPICGVDKSQFEEEA